MWVDAFPELSEPTYSSAETQRIAGVLLGRFTSKIDVARYMSESTIHAEPSSRLEDEIETILREVSHALVLPVHDR